MKAIKATEKVDLLAVNEGRRLKAMKSFIVHVVAAELKDAPKPAYLECMCISFAN